MWRQTIKRIPKQSSFENTQQARTPDNLSGVAIKHDKDWV